MSAVSNIPLVRCFLLKVASRCNINCDYCYMYTHLDQSWKTQPTFMTESTLKEVARRICDYAIEENLDRFVVVYHGGEPLLIGSEKLIEHAQYLKDLLPEGILAEFSIQTNGTLLQENDVIRFQDNNIQVSLSLDGPAFANDRHRLNNKGQSSFIAVERALEVLERYPKVFSGVIAVIDSNNDPEEIMSFFGSRNIPQLDFLLPDANYLRLPKDRSEDFDRYKNWLISCFDLWFDKYPSLKLRMFDTILASLLGAPSETDGLGYGDVSLITIESDGSYHDLDVLKITGTGTNLNKGNVHISSIKRALESEQIAKHRLLLRKEGLSIQCQSCSVVSVCGGGSVAHRYNSEGYANPSIYCHELKSLIEHANQRAIEQFNIELDHYFTDQPKIAEDLIEQFEIESGASTAFMNILTFFKLAQVHKFKKVVGLLSENLRSSISPYTDEELQYISIQPSIVAWTDVMEKNQAGITVHNIDGEPILPEPEHVKTIFSLTDRIWPRVQRQDLWLQHPFGSKIFFEDPDILKGGELVLIKAIDLITAWNPSILDEMKLISPEIQFIRDPSAHPDKIVSFSDNSVPGALYVQLKRGNGFVDACDLADSLIHEHRHQKLYLLQRVCPIINADYPLVKSPWREELRPPSGLFHALYVFVMLLDFWSFLQKNDSFNLVSRAETERDRISQQLNIGFTVVKNCDLTGQGNQLLNLLEKRYTSLLEP